MTFHPQNPATDDVTPSTIILRGMDEPEIDTLPCVAEVRPGMLLERVDGHVQPHSTDGGVHDPLVAIEQGVLGMAVDSTLEAPVDISHTFDRYAAGTAVNYGAFDKDHVLYMLLAPGETVEEDIALASNGDGSFRATAGDGTDADPTFRADEAVDNAGGDSMVRLRARVR